MEGLARDTPMTDLLRERGVFERHPFVLIDAGCAGGIDAAWRVFGPSLVAHGYDPDVRACEEARAREPFPHVQYHAAFIGLSESHEFAQRRRAEAGQWPDTSIWERVTAGYLARKQRQAEPGDRAGRPLADPSATIGIDDVVRGERLDTVDFLKVDVDGPDFDVLESARSVLGDSQVLGVGLEVNWTGSANPTEHTFHNTDRFLREHGYAFFGATLRPYSRVDLPAPFLIELYAQTRFGQPFQGDAIYVRDLAAPQQRELAATYSADKLVKLACIYELIGVPDCAAEVLNRFWPQLSPCGDVEPLLDALTPPLLGEKLTYREYMSKFEAQPELFLPSAAEAARTPTVDDEGAAQGPPVGQDERPKPDAPNPSRGVIGPLARRIRHTLGFRART